jgi:pilus assembly protein CpaB
VKLPIQALRVPKEKLPLIAALGLGLLAGVTAYWGLKRKEADVRQGWNLVPVVVASRDLPEGSAVTLEMMMERSIPEQFATTSVVKPDLISLIENQRLLVPVQRGDPFLWTQFETTQGSDRLASKIQRKGRAITIDVSKRAAVGGWVRPNDHVDVLATFRDPHSNQQMVVTLLQNVIVLATGRISGTSNTNLASGATRDYGNVSLLVLPEEAEILALASELGSLALSLRSDEDVDPVDNRGHATIQTLLSGERAKTLQEKRHQTIQIIRGTAERTTIAGTRER